MVNIQYMEKLITCMCNQKIAALRGSNLQTATGPGHRTIFELCIVFEQFRVTYHVAKDDNMKTFHTKDFS